MSDHVHDEFCDHDHDDDDEDGIDLIKLTLVGEQMHCALDPSVFEDEPGTWGVVLATWRATSARPCATSRPSK